MAIGNLDWTQRGGMLTLTERWGLTLAAIRKQIDLRRQAQPVGASGARNALDRLGLRALDQIEHPWDALAFAASTAAQELQPQWLTNHGWRTYAWGTLLALKADLKYDKSLLFSACMLHDLGLTPHAAAPSDQCFTLRSSLAASDILRSAGASEAQLHCVAQAITLHLNLEVGVEHGVEAHLVHAGAGLDVVGQRSQEVPVLLRQVIVEKHPRLGFKHQFCNCMRIESRSTPNSRTGLYVRRLRFLDLIGQAPFDE
jgi:hypothetical protein